MGRHSLLYGKTREEQVTILFQYNYELLGVTMLTTILLLALTYINHSCGTKRYNIMKLGLHLLLVNQIFDIFRARILFDGAGYPQPVTYIVFVGYYLSAATVMILIVMYSLLQFPWLSDHSQRMNTIFFICEFTVTALILTTVQTGFVYKIRQGHVMTGIGDGLFYFARVIVLIGFVVMLPKYRRMLTPRIFRNWIVMLVVALLLHIPPLFIYGLNVFAVFANVFFAMAYSLFYSGNFEEGTARMGMDMYHDELAYQFMKKKNFYVYEVRLINYEALVERNQNRYGEKDLVQMYRLLDERLHDTRHVYIYQKSVNCIGIVYAQADHALAMQAAQTICEVLGGSFGGDLQFRAVGVECPRYAVNETDIMRLFYALQEKCPDNNYLLCNEDDYEQFCEKKDIMILLNEMQLEKQDVVLFGRPVVDSSGLMTDRMEILCRLQLAGKGIIHSDQVIRLAERYGYIHEVNMLVLNNICEFLRKDTQAARSMRVSLHISSEELENPQFMDDVCRILKRFEIGSEKIDFEVTLASGQVDIDHVRESMQQLRMYQIGFVLSEFDPSSVDFESVAILPFRAVKFSGKCVHKACENRTYYDMTGMLVDMLKERGYTIVFTGINNDELEDIAVSLGADYMQGKKYARPFPIEEIEMQMNMDHVF